MCSRHNCFQISLVISCWFPIAIDVAKAFREYPNGFLYTMMFCAPILTVQRVETDRNYIKRQSTAEHV